MIKASDIYAASHDGLDIILYYYPQAEGCVDNRKKFKIRPDEDDASACIRKYGDCYKVTDFGDQGHGNQSGRHLHEGRTGRLWRGGCFIGCAL